MFIDDEFFKRTNKPEAVQYLFNMFPVGMMIFEKITKNRSIDFQFKYINETALKVLRKANTKSEEQFKKTLKKFNKLEKFSTINEVHSCINDVTEENLYNRIFDNLDQTETEICERYVSKDIMIYVKIKIYQQYKLVSIENFNDERITIQNNIIKNIKTQHLLTLSHELNNPLNSLSYSVNEIISTKELTKPLMNGMKINIRLIKFFIKNFIFSLKMSLEMNTLIDVEKKKEEDCINIENVFNKIKEKYSIFFRSKKINLDCNLNPMLNIFVTYKYQYFKSMIKNIFMYLFYRVERAGRIKIELIFDKELKIIFKNDYTKINTKNYLKTRPSKETIHFDTSFVNEINIESSVKTIKILSEIIHKFGKMLGIKLSIIEDESPCYLILSLKHYLGEDASEIGQDLAEEFTNRESKKVNTMMLDRSVNVVLGTRGQSKKVLNASYFVRVGCLNSSIDSWNLSKISPCVKTEEKKDIIDERKLTTKISILKGSKSHHTPILKNCLTSPTYVQKSVSFSSANNLERNKSIIPYSNHKKMVRLSNPTFKYYHKKSFENDLDSWNNLLKGKKNKNSAKNKSILNQYSFNKKDIREDAPGINKLGNEKSIQKYNIKSPTVGYDSPELSPYRKKNSSFSPLDDRHEIQNNLGNKFKESLMKLSPISNIITKVPQQNNNKTSVTTPPHFKLPRSITSQLPDIKHPDILVVDDDSFNLDVLQSMLRKLNLSCDTCMNGLECINNLQSKYEIGIEYKLILMDVMMPVMDGIEASNRVEELIKNNKLNKNLKIIIISAHDNQEIIDRATKLSVVEEFLSKPVKLSSIRRIIAQYYKE